MNCKEYTKSGHFAPPSMGEPGFFTCAWKEKGPPLLTKWVEVMPGVLREVPIDETT